MPVARPMKLAVVSGASFVKSLQVMRPMLVSKTAVGPVGWSVGLMVESGESGSVAGAVGAVPVGGGCSGGGLVCCASAPAADNNRAKKMELYVRFMPCLDYRILKVRVTRGRNDCYASHHSYIEILFVRHQNGRARLPG